ncbi:hypothetical protein [Thermoplasma volcanium]|uniref:hypothetical protein n=1 Tax=Thermoplasma volcanium TaxID=50339 RepID=UPI0012EAD9A1|nr:hypothetical protein [Thermoplasma volcanium]
MKSDWNSIGYRKYVKNIDVSKIKDIKVLRKFIIIRNLIMLANVTATAIALLFVWGGI